MLSRVANNLFWMDRYMERSYGLLNLIKTNYNSTLDSGDLSSWNKIMQSYLGVSPEREFKNHQDSIPTILYMLFDIVFYRMKILVELLENLSMLYWVLLYHLQQIELSIFERLL